MKIKILLGSEQSDVTLGSMVEDHTGRPIGPVERLELDGTGIWAEVEV